MSGWLLVLLIMMAIAVPAISLLRFFPALQVLDARVRGERPPRSRVYLASLFPAIASVLFLAAGTAILVLGRTPGFGWSLLGIALLMFTASVRSALHLAMFHSRGKPAVFVRNSQYVQATGYFAAGLAFLTASFRESWWCLLVAAAFFWLGSIYVYVGKKSSAMGPESGTSAPI